ncbi:MAG: replication protein [Eubacteriales bacterium]|nr:replication protein [Eubacteriales bacterium]
MAKKKTGNPQKEDGYTPIANELLEAMAAFPLTSMQYQILLIVLRQTYGFQCKSSDLSIGYIAAAIKRNKRRVGQEVAKLISANVLTEYQKATYSTARKIGINKHYEQWSMSTDAHSERERSQKYVPTRSQGMSTDAHRGMSAGAHQINKERNIKEKERKDFPSESEEPDAWELLEGEVIS